VVDLLSTIPTELSLQWHATVSFSVFVDSKVTGDLKIRSRHQEIVRKHTARNLLAISAMAEACREFLGRGADIDGDVATQAMACECHGGLKVIA
jgi:hypothetical protein